MWGANPDELRAVGRGFARSSSGVTYSARSLDSEVMAVQWLGRDADLFRNDWFEISEWMRELALHLDEIETELERQAAEQDAASAADGRAFGKASARSAGGAGFSLGSLAGSLMGAADGDDRPDPSPQPSPTPDPYPDDSSDQEPPVPTIAKQRADYSWEEDVRRQLEALEAGNDPHAVAAWFRDQGLDPADPADAERLKDLGRLFPDEIGNLEGAPYVARDAANQTVMNREIQRLQHEQQVSPDTFSEGDAARLRDLQNLKLVMDESTNPAFPRSLIELHVHDYEHVQASVASGNLDLAENVTVFVPGMDNTVSTIQDAVQSGEAILHKASFINTQETYASVAFLNFDTPKGVEEVSNIPAIDGARFLQNDLEGLNAARGDRSFELSLIGHSYGTNVIHHALVGQGDRFGQDKVFYIGSAGLPDLPGDSFYVYGSAERYATEAEADKTAGVGRFTGTHWRDPRDINGFVEYDSTNPQEGHEGSYTHDARGPGAYFNDDSVNVRVIAEEISR